MQTSKSVGILSATISTVSTGKSPALSSFFTHWSRLFGADRCFGHSGEKRKLWVLLITCLATRAVWLDGILDLSAKTFLHALRRFIAKRGCPRYILSDNASNFTLTNKALSNIWDQALADSAVSEFMIKRKFNGNSLCQWSVGRVVPTRGFADLQKLLLNAQSGIVLPFDDMQTLIAEVEAILNSRPLMTLDDNPDSILMLRPFDFLQDGGNPSLPPLNSDGEDNWCHNLSSAETLVANYQQNLRCKTNFGKFGNMAT